MWLSHNRYKIEEADELIAGVLMYGGLANKLCGEKEKASDAFIGNINPFRAPY